MHAVRRVSYPDGGAKESDKRRKSKSIGSGQKPKAILLNAKPQQYRVILEGEDVTPHCLYVPPPDAKTGSIPATSSTPNVEESRQEHRQSILLNMQSLNLFQTKLFQQTLQAEQSFQGGGPCMGDSMEAFVVPVYVPEQKIAAQPAKEEQPKEGEQSAPAEKEGEKKLKEDAPAATEDKEQKKLADNSKLVLTESPTEHEKIDAKVKQEIEKIKREHVPKPLPELKELEFEPETPNEEITEEKEIPESTMPKTINVKLLETDTYFSFEIRSTCADKATEEGIKVEEDNEQYEFMTVGKGRNRKVVQAETQTPNLLVKNVATMAEKPQRHDQTTFVSNYVMYDTYFEKEVCDLPAMPQIIDTTVTKAKQINTQENLQQFIALLQKESFLNALQTIERLLDTNVYHRELKRYCSIVKQDINRMDAEYNFRLDLLWTYKNWNTEGRPIADMSWNPANSNILAVGYGKYYYLGKKDGAVMLWNIKNPTQPERTFMFESPVTSLAFCQTYPNLLAVGFYSGKIFVLNVTSFATCIITGSSHETSPCYEAVWQLKWFTCEEGPFKAEEQLLATTQDGRVNKYKLTFLDTVMPCFQVMRIIREEGMLKGATQYRSCPAEPITLARFSPAVIFTPHPVNPAVYYVGTYEGTVHKCSKNNYHQHIEAFLAHNGPISAMRFSPFANKIFLTSGADWKLRIWAEGIEEPLIELGYGMRAIENAVWHPINSTVIACITGNEIHIWDLERRFHQPQSITVSPTNTSRYVTLIFSECGKNIIVGDVDGDINVFTMEDMPIPPHEGTEYLQMALEKALITKPDLLKQLEKIGKIYWDKHSHTNFKY